MAGNSRPDRSSYAKMWVGMPRVMPQAQCCDAANSLSCSSVSTYIRLEPLVITPSVNATEDIMTRIIEKEKVAYGQAMTPATTTRMDDGRLAGILRTYLDGRKRAAERRNLVAELNGLDDASLADIGLKRWEIGEAANRFGGPKGPSFAWLVGRLGTLAIGRAARVVTRWYNRQKAYQELMSLDEHTLRDIGISRTEIPALISQMATVDHRAVPAGWTLEDELVRPLRQWNRSRATAKTLSAMDDRMLSDIGMVRGDIDWVSETMARRSVGAANTNQNPQAA